MTPLDLLLGAIGVLAGTGVLTLLLVRSPNVATSIAALGALAGGTVGLWASVSALRSGFDGQISAPWAVPGGGFVVGVDPVSALFLAPLFVLGALCAFFGRSYLGARVVPAAELNLLLAAIALILLARHALLLLVAWEAMTVLCYLLLTTDHGEPEVRRAGWMFLIASHVGVMALLGLFVALGARAGGSLDFDAFKDAWQEPTPGAVGILALALVGFGVKAGVIGLHVWLPEAHAAAPSHVSALMSAVIIKLGIYGLLRTTLLVSPGAWFGVALMILGVAGALFGIALALGQRDLKRILAYSSVENVGIILMGLGLGFWARAQGDAGLSAIAFGGGLLHVWNHAAMKGLLFLGAGSVLHGTGTKDIERLGGLLGRMRWTGRAMILGSVAIAGLPPLNGFTGEWLLYRGLAQVGVSGETPSNLGAMGGAAALALVGGLSALCFARLVGVVLLGVPRDEGSARAHESPVGMTIPMLVLAAVCIVGAIAAPALVSLQASVLAELRAGSAVDAAAVSSLLSPLVVTNLLLFLALALAAALVAWRVGMVPAAETWACGYAAPTSRMQYTGRAFSALATRVLPRWIRARLHVRPPEGPFPVASTFASDPADPLTRSIYEPLLVTSGKRFARLRFVQQGNLHIYLSYILAAVIGGLVWVAVRDGVGW